MRAVTDLVHGSFILCLMYSMNVGTHIITKKLHIRFLSVLRKIKCDLPTL